MATNIAFMQTVVGKALSLKYRYIATFNTRNQIAALQFECGLAQAFCDLLKDPVLTANVLADNVTDAAGIIKPQYHTTVKLLLGM